MTRRQHIRGKIQRSGQAPEDILLVGHFVDEEVWKTILKVANETRNSTTTFADDADLQFAVEANAAYIIRWEIYFNTSATPDFKFQFVGPASPDEVTVRGKYVAVGNTNDTDFVDTAFSQSHAVTGTGGTTGGHAFGSILLQNGANGGVVAVQWAQNTSDAADTTVLAGSYIEGIKV